MPEPVEDDDPVIEEDRTATKDDKKLVLGNRELAFGLILRGYDINSIVPITSQEGVSRLKQDCGSYIEDLPPGMVLMIGPVMYSSSNVSLKNHQLHGVMAQQCAVAEGIGLFRVNDSKGGLRLCSLDDLLKEDKAEHSALNHPLPEFMLDKDEALRLSYLSQGFVRHNAIYHKGVSFHNQFGVFANYFDIPGETSLRVYNFVNISVGDATKLFYLESVGRAGKVKQVEAMRFILEQYEEQLSSGRGSLSSPISTSVDPSHFDIEHIRGDNQQDHYSAHMIACNFGISSVSLSVNDEDASSHRLYDTYKLMISYDSPCPSKQKVVNLLRSLEGTFFDKAVISYTRGEDTTYTFNQSLEEQVKQKPIMHVSVTFKEPSLKSVFTVMDKLVQGYKK